MITVENVRSDLNAIRERFQKFISTTNYAISNNEVSWNNYVSGIYNGVNYLKEYKSVVQGRQYSFYFNDGKIFQFFYGFENGEVKKARLCVLPPPIDIPENAPEWIEEVMDYSLLFGDELAEDDDRKPYRAHAWSHIRLDFDDAVDSHEAGHIQFGALNKIRLPSEHLLLPFSFFVFVLRAIEDNNYQEARHKHWFEPALNGSLARGNDLALLADTILRVSKA